VYYPPGKVLRTVNQVRSEKAEAELEAVRRSLRCGRPFGSADWVDRMAERLGIDLGPVLGAGPPRKKTNGH
jgi:hypothetical protein